MSQQTEQDPAAVDAERITLGELSEIPIDRRCEFISKFDREGLQKACADHPLHPKCGEPVFADRVAWGLAFNIGDPPGASTAKAPKRITDDPKWKPNTLWTTFWKSLSTPEGGKSVFKKKRNPAPDPFQHANGDTWLKHLAKSISCEQRDDWQHPAHRPIDLKVADASFTRLFVLYESFVLAVIKKQIAGIGPDDDALVNSVFEEAFGTYWHPASNARFNGTSKISTFLHTIAWRVCVDYLRAQKKAQKAPQGESASLENVPAPVDLDSPTGLKEQEIEFLKLQRGLDECLKQLEPKHAVVYYAARIEKIPQNQLAPRFGVSAVAINHWLKAADIQVRKCMDKFR